jgi:hypothetical protein
MMAAETSQAWLVLLTIGHQTGTARFTSDSTDTSFNGNTYYQLPFDIILPTNETGKVPEATLILDNVDRQLIAQLRTQSVPMTVQIDVVASGDVAGGNATATYSNFVLRSIDYTQTSISGRLTLEDFLAEPYPKDIFSQSLFPGLFGFGTTSDYTPPVIGQDATDFSEYTPLSTLPDWTDEFSNAAVMTSVSADNYLWSNPTGDRVGQIAYNSSSTKSMHTWDEIGVGDDVEIYAKAYRDGTPVYMGVVLRVTGTHPTDLEAYYFGVDSSGTPEIGYVSGGSDRTLLASGSPDIYIQDHDPIFFRFRSVGSTLQGKVWGGKESEEPTAWTVTTTDTTITSAGRVGIYGHVLYGGAGYYLCDYFIVKNPLAYSYPSEIGAPETINAINDDFTSYTAGGSAYNWLEAPATPYGSISAGSDDWVGYLKHSNSLQVTMGAVRIDSTMCRDQEILLLMYYTPQTSYASGAMLRWNDNVNHFYYAVIDSSGNGLIGKYNGSSAQLGSTVAIGLSQGLVYIRFRVTGTELKVKWWQYGSSEPDWMATEYDQDNNVGHPGFLSYSGTTSGRVTYYKEVAMAFNGATASF